MALYLGYDRAGLDAQYDNRARFPFYKDYFAKWPKWSKATRRKLRGYLDVPHGPARAETLDVFPAAQPLAPIHVFVHGGYWYSLDKDDFSFVAEGFVPNGVMSVVLNYGLAPAHSMDEIVRQNRTAIAWLYRNAAKYGGDPTRIYVCGQSAGGHLVAMLAVTDWPAFAPDLPGDLITGACATSGVFDLEPIRLCYLNDFLRMDAAEAARNSPVHLPAPVALPLLLVVGEHESAEFHRQSQAMAARWRALGHPVALIERVDEHHYAICDALRDRASYLVATQLDVWAREGNP
ncbi:MAG: alpha/beta hydrolase [Alphaproteobacteria bacterium]|nr:alpha/beta hydrolase [Alphaproteobacteria bacterium]